MSHKNVVIFTVYGTDVICLPFRIPSSTSGILRDCINYKVNAIIYEKSNCHIWIPLISPLLYRGFMTSLGVMGSRRYQTIFQQMLNGGQRLPRNYIHKIYSKFTISSPESVSARAQSFMNCFVKHMHYIMHSGRSCNVNYYNWRKSQ